MNRRGDQFLASTRLAQEQHTRIRWRYPFDLVENGLQRCALANDVAKGKNFPNLLPKMIPLQLGLLSEPSQFLEGPRIGERHGGVISKRSEPLELALLDVGATEDGQDAQCLALEYHRLARKRSDSFRLCPIRMGNRRVRREIVRYEHRRSRAADTAHLPNVQRDATEVTGEAGPVLA